MSIRLLEIFSLNICLFREHLSNLSPVDSGQRRKQANDVPNNLATEHQINQCKPNSERPLSSKDVTDEFAQAEPLCPVYDIYCHELIQPTSKVNCTIEGAKKVTSTV